MANKKSIFKTAKKFLVDNTKEILFTGIVLTLGGYAAKQRCDSRSIKRDLEYEHEENLRLSTENRQLRSENSAVRRENRELIKENGNLSYHLGREVEKTKASTHPRPGFSGRRGQSK